VPVPESPLEETKYGLVPKGNGWFVVNARDAAWMKREGRGALCTFEGKDLGGEADFSQLGINIRIFRPGEPISMYHWEADQEDFLVVSGEALAIVEGEERQLKAWDFVHCPAGTKQVIAGAGDGPCVMIAVGARARSTGPDWGSYPVDEVALRHGAGVETETTDENVAYARFKDQEPVRYREGWLP
jgi:uncharacterized cupin superfamily protein